MLNGDLDHDGQITVADIVIMSNIVLQNRSAEVISGDFTIEEPTPTYTIYYGTGGKTFDPSTADVATLGTETDASIITLEGTTFYKWVAIPTASGITISEWRDMIDNNVMSEGVNSDGVYLDIYGKAINGNYTVYYVASPGIKDGTTYKVTLNK